MSDTPRTDAIKIQCGFQAVPEPMLQHARELERENAELRADNERMDWLDHNAIPWNWMSPEKIDGLGPIVVTWKSNRTLRAAIDAARKEAQP